MNLEEPYKMGFLSVPQQSFLRRTWIKKYCALYNSSNHGIHRVELFDSEDAFAKQACSKIIPLSDCIKVTPAPQKQQPNVFEIRTKDNSYQFSADTFQDMSEWLLCLQTVAFSKTEGKLLSSVISVKEEKQEENMLYSSMDEPELFVVKVVSTEASLRNGLKGEYKLIITSVNLSIAEESSQGRVGRICLTWPYRLIRRYGCGTETFSFEAGRKCVSGEGIFTFATLDGMLIFQSVDAHVSALKSSQPDDDDPSSPNLCVEKNSFFTTKDSLLDKNFNSQNPLKVDSFATQSGTEIHSLDVKRVSLSKHFPPVMKPPRKSKDKISHLRGADNVSITNVDVTKDSHVSNEYEEIYRRNDSEKFSLDSASVKPVKSRRCNSESAESSLFQSVEKLQICDASNETKSKHTYSSFGYEMCDPLCNKYNSRSSVPDDHVYGKLLNTKQNSAEFNTYGSLFHKSDTSLDSPASPVYSNVQTLAKVNDDENDNMLNNPDHFIKNDAEYAQVCKKYNAD